MINLKDIKSVFLIGIGGIGMSALARYFHEKGCRVSGYDRVRSSLTEQMEKEGILINYKEEIKEEDKHPAFVIYTPAIGKEHILYQYFTAHRIPVYKRSEVLQMILRDMECIAVAGTHGKTTISSMIAHILRESGWGCHAFLGGVAVNYNTNYWSSERSLAVVEADEYDRSFLRLEPDKAVISAIDADHLDIYQTEQNIRQAFIDFTHKIKPGGLLIYKKNINHDASFGGDRRWHYHLTDIHSDIHAGNINMVDGRYQFDVTLPGAVTIEKVTLNIGGRHNIENALAAVAMSYETGVSADAIRVSLASYKGVKRRFEYIIKKEDQVYIDDYAHHPEELRMLLSSVKDLYPDDQCTIVFQPHLYSRTRDFAVGFAAALDQAEEVILLPVYPAREDSIPGVDSQLIAGLLKKDKVNVYSKAEALKKLERNRNKIVVTAGAGDIGAMVQEIKTCLENKEYKNRDVG